MQLTLFTILVIIIATVMVTWITSMYVSVRPPVHRHHAETDTHVHNEQPHLHEESQKKQTSTTVVTRLVPVETQTVPIPYDPQVHHPSSSSIVSSSSSTNGTPSGTPYSPDVSENDTNFHHLGYVVSSQATRNAERLMLPLYGHRKFPRAERYEYYVTDKNGIEIPFEQKNEAQLWDGDKLVISGFDTTFVAKIYPPAEIPYTLFPITV